MKNFKKEVGTISNSNSNPIGFFDISFIDDTIYLNKLEIIPQFQKQIDGKILIEEFFKKYPDCKRIMGTATEASVGFYIAVGAEIYETCKGCYCEDCPNHPLNNSGISGRVCDEYSEYNYVFSK